MCPCSCPYLCPCSGLFVMVSVSVVVSMCVSVSMSVFVSMFLGMSVSVTAFLSVYMYVCVWGHISVRVHVQFCVGVHRRVHVLASYGVLVRVRVYVSVRVRVCVHVRANETTVCFTCGLLVCGTCIANICRCRSQLQGCNYESIAELSTGRMDPRVGSGRVTILPDFGGSGRVGSALRILKFLLIISCYLNRYESSNTAFGLIDFLRYLMYNN